MAALAVPVLPAVANRPSVQTTRSMTRPMRDPGSNGGKRIVKKGEPVDPEDLTRRLNEYLAEQKVRADRRRDARAAKAAVLAQQNAAHYHHVPKVAATAFERTTTPDVRRGVHHLAQPAIRAHLGRSSIDDSLLGQQTTKLQRTQALEQAILEKELLRSRNQFQWGPDMEDAAYADAMRDLHKLPQRTFSKGFPHLKERHRLDAPRPLSTGDIFWGGDELRIPTKTTKPRGPLKPINDGQDRHDWAQRDEATDIRKKDKTTPFLRKMESRWILMSKREKSPLKQDIDLRSSPEGKKGNLFARFKRQPG
ncbi:hypothetical protein LZ554_006034 [Drepanopeziza brunnea f. sp. 'monogermtubi']|nr:hypothetical protein LZ554_006034 [Drepanopeziza brunnea f. sp. 'monogermtubi']